MMNQNQKRLIDILYDFWNTAAQRISHKMDYRITYGLIWALVLLASCDAYINEDMRGEFSNVQIPTSSAFWIDDLFRWSTSIWSTLIHSVCTFQRLWYQNSKFTRIVYSPNVQGMLSKATTNVNFWAKWIYVSKNRVERPTDNHLNLD